MIVEFALAAAAVYLPKHIKGYYNRSMVKNSFEKAIHELNIKNKSGETYSISKIFDRDFGYFCTVRIPKGIGFEKLEKAKEVLEVDLKALIEMEIDRYQNYAKLTVVRNPKNEEKTYQVEPQEPYEFFVGYDRKGKPIKINMNKTAHLLVAGITGKGKSRLLFIGLTNLAKVCKPEEVHLYMTQIRKNDFKKYARLPHLQLFATTLEQTVAMFERLDSKIDQRNDTLESWECENIFEYNQKNKIKMPYIFLLAEEFSFYMPKPGENETIVNLKNRALTALQRIAVSGRNVGLFILAVTQRSTAANFDVQVKSQVCRLSFKQKSVLDSMNMLDITDATKLKDREFILNSDDFYYGMTPYIDREIISQVLKDVFKPLPVEGEPEPYVEDAKPIYDVSYDAEPQLALTTQKLSGIMTLEELEEELKNDSAN